MRNAILLLALFCAACSNYSANLPSIKPYKMEINQGNVVTPKMMMQLRPGMTKSQVRFVMGTPLIADSFHANRWDYFYQMRKDGKVVEQRRVILEFEDEKLKRVRGDVVPAGSGATEPLAGDRPVSRTEPVTLKPAAGAAPKEKEKGMLDKLKFWKSDDKPEPAKPEAKPEPAAAQQAKPEELVEQPVAEEKVEPLPPLTEPDKAEAPAPAREVQPEPKAAAKPEPKPAEAAKPAEPKQEARPTPAPAPKVESKPEPKPTPRPVEKPSAEPAKVEPKQVPKPADSLPPEEDPSYFERMLEKIGF